MTPLQTNLLQSRQQVQEPEFGHYWLNPDGTVTEKTWWGRIVRWIENFLYDQTITDICTVFAQSVSYYLRLYNDFSHKIGDVSPEALSTQAKCVSFAARFLHSRLDRLLANPGLTSTVAGYLKALPEQTTPYTLANLQDLDLEIHDPRLKLLRAEDAELPELTPEMMSRAAPREALDPVTGDLFELVDCYEELSPVCRTPPSTLLEMIWNPVVHWWKSGPEKKALKKICRAIRIRDPHMLGIDKRQTELVYAEQELYLLHCIRLLRNQKIPLDKRWQTVCELVNIAGECVPRWSKELERQYLALAEGMTRAQALILQWKERLFEDFLQEERFDLEHTNHYLNGIAMYWGKKFGFSLSFASKDIFKTDQKDLPSETEIETVLKKKWAQRAVTAFKLHMNAHYNPDFHDILVSAVKERGIPDPEDFVSEEYYNHNGELNDRGVIRVLRETLVAPAPAG